MRVAKSGKIHRAAFLFIALSTIAVFPLQTEAASFSQISRDIYCAVNDFFGSEICSDINVVITQAPGERTIGLASDQGSRNFTVGLLNDYPQRPATTTIVEPHTYSVVERIYHTREVVQNNDVSTGKLSSQLEKLGRDLLQAEQFAQEVRQSADLAQKRDKDIWRAISQMNSAGSINTYSQSLSFSTATKALTITGGNSVDLSSLAASGNDDQTLALSGNTLSIEDGNNVDLLGFMDNTDNQIVDSFALTANIISLSLEGDGDAPKTVDCPSSNKMGQFAG